MTTEFLGGLFGYLILKLVLTNRESRILIPSRLELLLFLFRFVDSARRSVSCELMRNSDSRSWANELHSPSEAISRVLRYAIKASYVATGDRWVFVSPVDLAHPHPFHFAQGKKVQSLASFYSRAFSPNNLNYFFSPLSKGGNKSKGNFQ
jgi:hypothetical protein